MDLEHQNGRRTMLRSIVKSNEDLVMDIFLKAPGHCLECQPFVRPSRDQLENKMVFIRSRFLWRKRGSWIILLGDQKGLQSAAMKRCYTQPQTHAHIYKYIYISICCMLRVWPMPATTRWSRNTNADIDGHTFTLVLISHVNMLHFPHTVPSAQIKLLPGR